MEKKCINCKYYKLSISQCRCNNYDSEFFGHMVTDGFYCGCWDGIETECETNTDDTSDSMTVEYEYVEHPKHYGGKDNPYECIKVMRAYGLDKNFCLGSAFKYLVRAGKKPNEPQIRDLKKAADYILIEIEKLEEENAS